MLRFPLEDNLVDWAHPIADKSEQGHDHLSLTGRGVKESSIRIAMGEIEGDYLNGSEEDR